MFDDDIQQDIIDLRFICPSFDKYLMEESYLSKYGSDNYTDQSLLTDGYELAIDELNDMGIFLDDELLTDQYSSRYIYYFRKWFDADNFTKMMVIHPEWKESLLGILNMTEEDSDILNEMIEFFYHNTNNYETQLMYDQWLECSSTERFGDHIQAILENLPVSTISDPEMVNAYTHFIEQGRKNARDGVALILSAMDTNILPNEPYMVKVSKSFLNMDKLQLALKGYDLDKVRSDSVEKFMVFDTEFNKEPLHPSIIDEASAYMDIHHRSASHHFEYWNEIFKDPITNSDYLSEGKIPLHSLILITAHFYDPSKNIEEIRKEVTSKTDNMEHVPDIYKYIVFSLCDAFKA